MRSPRVEAVVAPTALAREGRDRHQLDRCDAELAQLAQARDDAVEGAHGTERADVELVDDEIVEREALPLWGPRQIDDRRRPSDPMRLPAGARVGPFAAVQKSSSPSASSCSTPFRRIQSEPASGDQTRNSTTPLPRGVAPSTLSTAITDAARYPASAGANRRE